MKLKNIVLLSSVFAMMNSSSVIGSDLSDMIVSDEVVVENPLYGKKIPLLRGKSLPKASSSSAFSTDYDDSEDESLEESLEEGKAKTRVPLLKLDTGKELSFDGISELTRKRLNDRKEIYSYRPGEYDFLRTLCISTPIPSKI